MYLLYIISSYLLFTLTSLTVSSFFYTTIYTLTPSMHAPTIPLLNGASPDLNVDQSQVSLFASLDKISPAEEEETI